MNIRKKVYFGFLFLILLMLSISFQSFITTFQIKENQDFSELVFKLIKLQEDMNEKINEISFEDDQSKLAIYKEDFLNIERKFEKLEKIIKTSSKKDLLDTFISDLNEDKNIISSLNTLYNSEKDIEKIFDDIYQLQIKKSDLEKKFDDLYPRENNLRLEIEKNISKLKNIKVIENFGHIKYYSKETLYQHRDRDSLDKWINKIDEIISIIDKNELYEKFIIYKEISKNIGQTVINSNLIELEKKQLINRLNSILKENKEVSLNIENYLVDISEKFLNTMQYYQIVISIITVLLALIISTYISNTLSKIISTFLINTKKLKNGNYDVKMKINDSEFDSVAKAFNQMATNIKEHQETLENKISNRTIELQKALEEVKIQKETLENLSSKLSKYLSPQIFESIFSGKQDVLLESKRKYLSVFFSDIKGFTSLTDTIETESLTNLLNEYLDKMSQIAIEYGGTIDKYIGDSIMIFFGDPKSNGRKEDALNCIKMAIDMRKAMLELKLKWLRDGFSHQFDIRMGISSGYCTVGNFGSKNRLDYTIIGNIVNLASRLENSAKDNQILISQDTYNLVNDEISCKKEEKIFIKGFTETIQTYSIKDENLKNTIITDKTGLKVMIDLNETKKDDVISSLKLLLNNLENTKDIHE